MMPLWRSSSHSTGLLGEEVKLGDLPVMDEGQRSHLSRSINVNCMCHDPGVYLYTNGLNTCFLFRFAPVLYY
jgi:hypothetical protein